MPNINDLSTTVAALSALSVVTERFVEIIKGLIPPLSQPRGNEKEECWRNTALRLLAVIGGYVTVYLAHDQLGDAVKTIWDKGAEGQILLGLLASGGSGFWNAVLKYVGAIKDLRKTDAAVRSETLVTMRTEALTLPPRQPLTAARSSVAALGTGPTVTGNCLSLQRAGEIVLAAAGGNHEIDEKLGNFLDDIQRDVFQQDVFNRVRAQGCLININKIPHSDDDTLQDVQLAIKAAAGKP